MAPSAARPPAVFRSRATDRLPRASDSQNPGKARVGSPPAGRSTLMTSAPRSARTVVAYGPGYCSAKLSSRTPASGGFTCLDAQAQAAGDQHPLNLRGTLADGEDPRVGVVPGGVGLLDEPVTTLQLSRLVGGLVGQLGGDQLGDRRLLLNRLAVVVFPGRVVGEHP